MGVVLTSDGGGGWVVLGGWWDLHFGGGALAGSVRLCGCVCVCVYQRKKMRISSDLLKSNLVIAHRVQWIVDQRVWNFSKMQLRAPFPSCVFSSQTQNATFSKKLHFGFSQTGFGHWLFSKWAFWAGKVETNEHLVTKRIWWVEEYRFSLWDA